MDAAARHIAEKLCITHAFAERKLKQHITERAITSGQAILDSDLPELAAEVVNSELVEQRCVPTQPFQAVAGEEYGGGFISAVHHHQLQKENVQLLDQITRLKAENKHLTISLEAAQSIANSATGEVDGLRSGIEIIVGELLRRVGPAEPQILHELRSEFHPQ